MSNHLLGGPAGVTANARESLVPKMLPRPASSPSTPDTVMRGYRSATATPSAAAAAASRRSAACTSGRRSSSSLGGPSAIVFASTGYALGARSTVNCPGATPVKTASRCSRAASAAQRAQLDKQRAQNDAIHLQVKTQGEIELAKIKAALDAKMTVLEAHLKAAIEAGKVQRSYPPGARKARDGHHYVPDPNRPGKYMLVLHSV